MTTIKSATMTNGERTEKYTPLIAATGAFEVLKVDSCNFVPHPFTIGTRHVTHAADHCGGMMGQETLEAIPCAERDCGQPCSAHTYDMVCFLRLTRDVAKSEVGKLLQPFGAQLAADGIDGIAFVRNAFKFTDG